MKVLFVHTYYQQKGGEDKVFQLEQDLMKSSVQTDSLTYNNATGLRGAIQFFLSLQNVFITSDFRRYLDKNKPDIIHIHNWHFATGPIIIRTAKKAGIPVILTVHNYRLLCPSATLLHDGKIFTESISKEFPWSAVRKKVYRNSIIQTFWLAAVTWWHKFIGTWDMVDKFIFLTPFAKDLFTNSRFKFEPSQLVVKPNFVVQDDLITKTRGSHFLFVGRLSVEKGLDVLLNAFKRSPYKLRIAGDGPLKNEVLVSSEHNPNITYLGSLSKDGIAKEMAACSALIFPSVWFEGMPMTLIEAFSLATPVIASDIGAMQTMITDGFNGLHFDPGSSVHLLNKIEYWSNLSDEAKKSLSDNALCTFQSNYTAERNKNDLLRIYKSVL